jgi:hypothetical protein
MPVIGVNESGKTTVLQAIFAFDGYNDDFNDNGRHLQDTSNLYRTSSPQATVTADIEFALSELKAALLECEKDYPPLKIFCESMRARRKLPTKLRIRRNIVTKAYTILESNFGSPEFQEILSSQLLVKLPYILYFDDFRDKIAERIEIPNTFDELADWSAILHQLFKQTDKTFSLLKISKLEERQRRTVLAKVERHLNDTLTKEWQGFKLDDREALKIAIGFERGEADSTKSYLKLDIVEKDSNGDEHFFFISDRSKGFYWFFNFVMKLQFNPKLVASGFDPAQSIYLLDEPGSYLHAFAQRKLCVKLKQISEKHTVIFCTHSQYLLDPETIPPSCIVVADKSRDGDITLTRMIDYKGSATENRSTLQPVLDALQIKPYAFDLAHQKVTVIVEGIYDYFALTIFKPTMDIGILPSVGADSIKFYISLMIGWQVSFRALWDHDDEGKKKFEAAKHLFGEEVTKTSLRLLPTLKPDGKRILQDLFAGPDLAYIRGRLEMSGDIGFERTIHSLFYSPLRDDIVANISQATKLNFSDLFTALSL